MHKPGILAAIVCLACVALHATPDPRIYLKSTWYIVEIIAFKPKNIQPTTEDLIHGADLREVPQDLLVLSREDDQYTELEEREHDDVNGDIDSRTGHTTTNRQAPVSGTSVQSPCGCWLHQCAHTTVQDWIPNEESDSESASNQIFQEDELPYSRSITFDELLEEPKDSDLPEWLPSDWESDENILRRAGEILGVCEEDMATMIASHEFAAIGLDDESAEVPITVAMIRQAFGEYERELQQTQGNRRSNDLLVLTHASKRLADNGFRVIDHASWHQEALERGANQPLLIQFGDQQPEDQYEVEGTVELSSARFLHLAVNLWKSISTDEHPIDNEKSPRLLYYTMKESRRLILGETHYFDHPKFGLLVRVQRLPVPDRLVALLE